MIHKIMDHAGISFPQSLDCLSINTRFFYKPYLMNM